MRRQLRLVVLAWDREAAVKRFRIWDYLRSSLWFVPILCVLVGVGLSFATIAIDRSVGTVVPRSLSGDPDAALAILSTVAMSMVTLTGLVLTITMVVVQLAMGQFTPRVIRTILRDRPSQLAIGVFVATFAHAMLVMREVAAPSRSDPDGFVPGLAIVVAFVLILISIMVLVSYVHHIGQSLRVASLIDSVGDDTRKLLFKLYPEVDPGDEDAADLTVDALQQVVPAPSPGVLYKVDERELLETAESADVTIVILPRVGDFVPQGAAIFNVHGGTVADGRGLLRAVALGRERTLHQDLAYGLQMLVDVAVRALSKSMGDPTTAVQALDRLHDCLRQLVQRRFPSGRHFDSTGSLRLVIPKLTWERYMDIAMDDLRQYAVSSIQVTRRLVAMLEDLAEVAPVERKPPLDRQLELLRNMATLAFSEQYDREFALVVRQEARDSDSDRVVLQPLSR
jgi:uncharacterized membrane protein